MDKMISLERIQLAVSVSVRTAFHPKSIHVHFQLKMPVYLIILNDCFYNLLSLVGPWNRHDNLAYMTTKKIFWLDFKKNTRDKYDQSWCELIYYYVSNDKCIVCIVCLLIISVSVSFQCISSSTNLPKILQCFSLAHVLPVKTRLGKERKIRTVCYIFLICTTRLCICFKKNIENHLKIMIIVAISL